jgi:hypothetical protein
VTVERTIDRPVMVAAMGATRAAGLTVLTADPILLEA